MSGYLSRLVMRSQPRQTSPTLRPFVRSKSPIAEQDQRLGVDGFDVAGTSLPNTDSWALEASEPASSDPFSKDGRESSITISKASSDVAEVTVQRKIAGPSMSPITLPAVPTSTTQVSTVDSTPERTQARPSIPADSISQDDRSQPSLPIPEPVEPPGRPRELEPDTPVDSVVRQPQTKTFSLEADATVASSARSPVVSADPMSADPTFIKPRPPVGPPSVVRDVSEKSEQTVTPSTMVPNSRRSELEPSNRQPIKPVVPNNIYSHIPRLERPVPRLEPLAPREDSREDTMEFEAAVSAPSPPAVVIGRINVEVVPQAPAVATAPASRSGPLTAASVSVIGPLRTGVRPNLRFSLRQR